MHGGYGKRDSETMEPQSRLPRVKMKDVRQETIESRLPMAKIQWKVQANAMARIGRDCPWLGWKA
jgi:hypothetical protein